MNAQPVIVLRFAIASVLITLGSVVYGGPEAETTIYRKTDLHHQRNVNQQVLAKNDADKYASYEHAIDTLNNKITGELSVLMNSNDDEHVVDGKGTASQLVAKLAKLYVQLIENAENLLKTSENENKQNGIKIDVSGKMKIESALDELSTLRKILSAASENKNGMLDEIETKEVLQIFVRVCAQYGEGKFGNVLSNAAHINGQTLAQTALQLLRGIGDSVVSKLMSEAYNKPQEFTDGLIGILGKVKTFYDNLMEDVCMVEPRTNNFSVNEAHHFASLMRRKRMVPSSHQSSDKPNGRSSNAIPLRSPGQLDSANGDVFASENKYYRSDVAKNRSNRSSGSEPSAVPRRSKQSCKRWLWKFSYLFIGIAVGMIIGFSVGGWLLAKIAMPIITKQVVYVMGPKLGTAVGIPAGKAISTALAPAISDAVKQGVISAMASTGAG